MVARKRHLQILPSWSLAGARQGHSGTPVPAAPRRRRGVMPRLARAYGHQWIPGGMVDRGPISTGCDHPVRARIPGLRLHRRSPQRHPPAGRA